MKQAVGVGIGSIAATFVFVVVVVQTIFFAISYLNRVLTVGFLIMISPIITLTYSIDKMADRKAQALGAWLKNFIYTIIIQPFHCIIYGTFISIAFKVLIDSNGVFTFGDNPAAKLSDVANTNAMSASVLVIMSMLFIKEAEKIVQQIFNIKPTNGAGTMAVGAAAAIMAAQKGAKVAGSLGSASRGVQNFGKGIAGKLGKDSKTLNNLSKIVGSDSKLGKGLAMGSKFLSNPNPDKEKNEHEGLAQKLQKGNKAISGLKDKVEGGFNGTLNKFSFGKKLINGYKGNTKGMLGKVMGPSARAMYKRQIARSGGAFLAIASMASGANVFQAIGLGKNYTNARLKTLSKSQGTLNASEQESVKASENLFLGQINDEMKQYQEIGKQSGFDSEAALQQRAKMEDMLKEKGFASDSKEMTALNEYMDSARSGYNTEVTALTAGIAFAAVMSEKHANRTFQAYNLQADSSSSSKLAQKEADIVNKVRDLLQAQNGNKKVSEEEVENYTEYLIAAVNLQAENNSYGKGDSSYEAVKGLVGSTFGKSDENTMAQSRALASSLAGLQAAKIAKTSRNNGEAIAAMHNEALDSDFIERMQTRNWGYDPTIDLTSDQDNS